jgi:hypothetical protein
MDVTKALHVLSMFAAVTVFLGGEFLYSWTVWRRDVRGLAWVSRTLETQLHIPVFGLGFLAAGIVFGLLTALTDGFDVLDGWLVAAYGLVALFLVVSALIGVPLKRLADKAVDADAGQRPVDDVVQDMAASSAVFFFPVNTAIFAAIILDMVLKPF